MAGSQVLERIAVSFEGGRGPQDTRRVDVRELARTLVAFQDAVYTTAAQQLQLPNARALNAQQRRQFALAVTDIEYSSIHILLTPENLTLAVAVYTAVIQTLQYFDQLSRPGPSSPEAEQVLPQLMEIEESATRRGGKTTISYGSAAGEEATFETSPEGNRRVLERHKAGSLSAKRVYEIVEPELPAPIEQFASVTVQDIVTTRNMLAVSLPEPDELLECFYPREVPFSIIVGIRIYDVITVLGRRHARRRRKGYAPYTVSIEAIYDAKGDIVWG